MRIRPYRPDDSIELVRIQQQGALADGGEPLDEQTFLAWLTAPERDAVANAFVVTDDDDELQTWSQAGTLEGIEGEIAGYTLLQMRRDQEGYHFWCEGTVLPSLRRRRVGRILLVGALNRARLLAMDSVEEQIPLSFEALLPIQDPGAFHLAEKFAMRPIDERPAPVGKRWYQGELE